MQALRPAAGGESERCMAFQQKGHHSRYLHVHFGDHHGDHHGTSLSCARMNARSRLHIHDVPVFSGLGGNCNCNHDCNCSSAWQHLTHTHTHAHAHNTHELLHHRHDVQHPGALPMAFRHVTRVFETLVHTIACVRWTVNYENTNAAPMAQLRKLPLTRVIITLSPGPSLPSPNLSASQPCNPLPRPALFQIPVCCIRPSSRALGS